MAKEKMKCAGSALWGLGFAAMHCRSVVGFHKEICFILLLILTLFCALYGKESQVSVIRICFKIVHGF